MQDGSSRRITEGRKMNLGIALRRLCVPLAAAALVLATTTTAMAAPAASKTPSFIDFVQQGTTQRASSNRGACWKMSIRSVETKSYVTNRLEYTGSDETMLTATSPAITNRELFFVCNTDVDTFSIESYVGDYVTTEVDYTGPKKGMLRARNKNIGAWEKYKFTCDTAKICYIKSVGAGKYVTAEYSYTGSGYGMLRARADNVGNWERFYIVEF
ncbi:fascin domain-containing protein [Micromonospora sp. CA-249363]|uniref:fascin domain-containing protein n=1 Tax=Micromonospora sp. CA-249363 TaxID=3239963 RepID=UPI003D915DAF